MVDVNHGQTEDRYDPRGTYLFGSRDSPDESVLFAYDETRCRNLALYTHIKIFRAGTFGRFVRLTEASICNTIINRIGKW